MLWRQLSRDDKVSGDLLGYAGKIISLYVKKDRSWREGRRDYIIIKETESNHYNSGNIAVLLVHVHRSIGLVIM